MAIHESVSAWRDESPNRCQRLHCCGRSREAQSPGCVKRCRYPPKGLDAQKGDIWPNALASLEICPLSSKMEQVVSIY
jgi:hypothetical protein